MYRSDTANTDLKKELRGMRVSYWMLGDALKVSDGTIQRMLRREMPPEQKEKFRAIARQIVEERNKAAAVS